MYRVFFLIILPLLSRDNFASITPWDKDQSRWTPLMKLAYLGDTVKIKELLNSGISVNLRNEDGWTALKVASKKGLTKTVDFLLRNGADANLSDKSKMTPLMDAALHNEKEIAKLPIKNKRITQSGITTRNVVPSATLLDTAISPLMS
jgi:ankyrin repeat protein